MNSGVDGLAGWAEAGQVWVNERAIKIAARRMNVNLVRCFMNMCGFGVAIKGCLFRFVD